MELATPPHSPPINRNLDVLWLIIVHLIDDQSNPSSLLNFLIANSTALALFHHHGFSALWTRLEVLHDQLLYKLRTARAHTMKLFEDTEEAMQAAQTAANNAQQIVLAAVNQAPQTSAGLGLAVEAAKTAREAAQRAKETAELWKAERNAVYEAADQAINVAVGTVPPKANVKEEVMKKYFGDTVEEIRVWRRLKTRMFKTILQRKLDLEKRRGPLIKELREAIKRGGVDEAWVVGFCSWRNLFFGIQRPLRRSTRIALKLKRLRSREETK